MKYHILGYTLIALSIISIIGIFTGIDTGYIHKKMSEENGEVKRIYNFPFSKNFGLFSYGGYTVGLNNGNAISVNYIKIINVFPAIRLETMTAIPVAIK